MRGGVTDMAGGRKDTATSNYLASLRGMAAEDKGGLNYHLTGASGGMQGGGERSDTSYHRPAPPPTDMDTSATAEDKTSYSMSTVKDVITTTTAKDTTTSSFDDSSSSSAAVKKSNSESSNLSAGIYIFHINPPPWPGKYMEI